MGLNRNSILPILFSLVLASGISPAFALSAGPFLPGNINPIPIFLDNGVFIYTETVEYGPGHHIPKAFQLPTGSSIPGIGTGYPIGQTFPVTETITIGGTIEWTNWHEQIFLDPWGWKNVQISTTFGANPTPVINSLAQGGNTLTGDSGTFQNLDQGLWVEFNPPLPVGTVITIQKDFECFAFPNELGCQDIPIPVEEWPTAVDHGDLPDPVYKTLNVNSGPSHDITLLFMGASIDPESDGQPNAAATGDDTDGNDDEDGVTWDPLVAGTTPDVHVDSTGVGFAFVWIDKDGTGPLTNAADRFGPFPIVAGNNDLTVDLTGYTVGDSFMRVRVCDTPSECMDPTGHAISGEVEDYKVQITERDEMPPPGPDRTVVGGEIIPLDTTMILAAGAQYTAAWMIPVIVSGIGIGIVIARKF